jgi:hypothetical protein
VCKCIASAKRHPPSRRVPRNRIRREVLLRKVLSEFRDEVLVKYSGMLFIAKRISQAA